jgi:hypothetical protein
MHVGVEEQRICSRQADKVGFSEPKRSFCLSGFITGYT